MKHEKEIYSLLRELLYEDWMREYDYNELLNELKKEGSLDLEKISNDIEIGISNGHTIEFQIEMIKNSFFK